jgi:hypothetical protein
MTKSEAQSSMRPASASGEKPPNTTEWMASDPRHREHGIGRLGESSACRW